MHAMMPGQKSILGRWRASAQRHADGLNPTFRALLWSMAAGGLFVVLNTVMRALAIALDPFQTQFLRYLGGLVVLLPLVARSGWASSQARLNQCWMKWMRSMRSNPMGGRPFPAFG